MEATLKIIYPREGDVLNRHDGLETEAGLTISVTGVCPENAHVAVNGQKARVREGAFSCDVRVSRRESRIEAECSGQRDEIAVWWDKGSRKRFRFSVDDNIEFLKDLGQHPDRYASLFDHWYLGFWQEMHREFGTKVHLNIYYQTEGFDLTQMPEKWKEEWQANAGWLHLSFHALQDKPDRPYRHARYAQMAHDFDLVCGHIRRFAGNEVLGNTTTIHWAECPEDAARALRDRGIERLVALFDVQGYEGRCTTGYYLSEELCAHADTRNAWHDRRTGITFIRCTAVINAFEAEDIAGVLDRRTATPHTQDLLELLIHEQYFRKELHYYQPSVMDKVREALRWAAGHGYEPVFWSDGMRV